VGRKGVRRRPETVRRPCCTRKTSRRSWSKDRIELAPVRLVRGSGGGKGKGAGLWINTNNRERSHSHISRKKERVWNAELESAYEVVNPEERKVQRGPDHAGKSDSAFFAGKKGRREVGKPRVQTRDGRQVREGGAGATRSTNLVTTWEKKGSALRLTR